MHQHMQYFQTFHSFKPKIIHSLGLDLHPSTMPHVLNSFIRAVAFTSAYNTSGGVSALISDASGTIDGFGKLFSDTAIASASSVDFLILTLSEMWITIKWQ